MTIKSGEDSDMDYIPANQVMHLFKQGNVAICAETEERIHGENVMVDFNIVEDDYTEEDVQGLIDEEFEFFID